MQIVGTEIHYPATVGVRHPGVLDVPFERHLPVEHLGAARDLVPGQLDAIIDKPQGLADAGTGYAAADRIQLGRKCQQLGARGNGSGFHAGIADVCRSNSRSN